MKILELLEGMSWNGYSWIGGASDEGHADFDPNKFGNQRSTVNRYAKARPQSPYRNIAQRKMIAAKVPFDAKDMFKELVGRGNYAWNGDTKTWSVNSAILTPELRQRLRQLNIELIEPRV